MKILLFTLGIVCSLNGAFAQNLNPNWNKDLENMINEFMACRSPEGGYNTCTRFLGQSLSTVYKVDDFYSKKAGRYMTVSEISDYVNSEGKWKQLGHAYDQSVLVAAQQSANDKKAVVAVYLTKERIGHVALILPGELHPSGTWGLRVPNTASFLLIQPENSFLNKGLSYAFSKEMLRDIFIYERSY